MCKKNDLFDPCLYFNISILNREINKRWQKAFEELGLSSSEAYLLYAFWKDQSLSQKELSDIFSFNQSTTTRFIESLKSKGLIKKEGQGKGSVIKVTKLGSVTSKKIEKVMSQLYETMQDLIGKSKFKSITKELTSLRGVLGDNNE